MSTHFIIVDAAPDEEEPVDPGIPPTTLAELPITLARVGPSPQKGLFAVNGADVFVQAADGSAIDIWQDSAGTIPLVSPLPSVNGRVTGWVDPGQHLRAKPVLPGDIAADTAWEYFWPTGLPGPPGIQGPSGMLTEVEQVAEADNTPIFVAIPATVGAAPFHVQLQSYPNFGEGAGTYNHGVWFGWNAARFAGGASTPGMPGVYMGFEDNYYDDGGDESYGPEWYVGYTTPDGTTIRSAGLRPFYFRVKEGDLNTADKDVLINLDMGGGIGSAFSLMANTIGGSGLITSMREVLICTREAIYGRQVGVFTANSAGGNGTLKVQPASGFAALDIQAPGVGANGNFALIAFKDGEDATWNVTATTGEFYVEDQVGGGTPRKQMSMVPGASDALALTTFSSRLRANGGFGLGVAPIAARAATADATDLATVIALANALNADLQAFGMKA